MRHIIATTKFKEGLQHFTKSNLRQLADFQSLNINYLEEDRVIGTAHSPRLSDSGDTLTAELDIKHKFFLDCEFSVAYTLLDNAFSVEKDEVIITKLRVYQIFPVAEKGLHD
jgi:hypothetical protein